MAQERQVPTQQPKPKSDEAEVEVNEEDVDTSANDEPDQAADDEEIETVVGEDKEEALEDIAPATVKKSAVTPSPAGIAAAKAAEAAKPKEPSPIASLAGAQKVEPHTVEDDQLSDHILDSPQAFGIWIGGELVQFKKGKTRLTNKQKDACLSHRYVRDNGASVLKLVPKKPK